MKSFADKVKEEYKPTIDVRLQQDRIKNIISPATPWAKGIAHVDPSYLLGEKNVGNSAVPRHLSRNVSEIPEARFASPDSRVRPLDEEALKEMKKDK